MSRNCHRLFGGDITAAATTAHLGIICPARPRAGALNDLKKKRFSSIYKMAKKSATVETTSPADVPAPVAAKAVKAPKAAAAPKKEKAPKVVAPAPVVDAAVPAAVVDDAAAVPAADVTTSSDKLADFGAKLQQLSAVVSSLKVEYKVLEKFINRDIKAAQKGSFRRKRSSGNRSPSGFVKPTRISDELATFLGKEQGAEMARTSVSKEINAYIKSHKLQDTTNGRTIHPDAPLTKLLGVNKDEILTYFNLQKYLKHHFVKASDAAAAAATA